MNHIATHPGKMLQHLMNPIRIASIPLVVLSLLFAEMNTAFAQGDRETGLPFASRSEVIAQNGMVATSHPLATQIGLDVLKSGGNAVDAAIAANAAIGLMEPTGNGIGGDLFALVWHAESQRVFALNASGRSPRTLSLEQLTEILDKQGRTSIHPLSLLSVSVPGAVDGWFELHERFGQASMADILNAPIHYAENGFPVTEAIASGWGRSVPRLIDQPGAFRDTFTIDGRAPVKGEIFANPDLGQTFRILAKEGRDGFYKGEIARKVDVFMREHGGYLTYEDFASHTSEWIDPISTTYRGHEIYQIGENNQGTAVLQMLNILEGYDLASMGFMSEEMLHVMIEAKKLVFEDRAKHYADPDFYQIPMDTLISKAYAEERRALIGDRAAARVTSGVEGLRHGGTIFLTTADRHGNMVSLIQSNFRGMGTGFVAPGTGFSLQNRGELFSMDPNHPNAYAPGKRPFHTIIPGLATKDGQGWFTFGVMGGEYQPMGHVSVLTNVIDFGMNIQEAGDALRWFHTGSTEPTDGADELLTDGGRVQIESNIDFQVVRALRARGHNVQIGGGFYGRYQGILFDPEKGVYFGASESRVDGQAAGY